MDIRLDRTLRLPNDSVIMPFDVIELLVHFSETFLAERRACGARVDIDAAQKVQQARAVVQSITISRTGNETASAACADQAISRTGNDKAKDHRDYSIMVAAEVAAELGVTVRRVHQLASSGQLPATKHGRTRMFRRDDLRKFTEERQNADKC